ncbi:hypothetical protein BYT27DRAFT_7099303 [Phlegmacium glaucopus]|nr:hypothetical protein BYT27DRAFT_7099303 [Phlegmacium glaucopus]
MFFSPELLTRRDSGFGLLWLAATLGSKSAFKKLPKRSVLTANITQLCDLISEPAEPLALRLSSNLMFGVVRVYKVKQEILMSDVTNCVTSLKKVVQDLRASGSASGQLQMANPVARHSALTIVPNPRAAYTLDYEALVADWEEYLNIGDDMTRDNDLLLEDDDGDFDPETQNKKRSKASAKAAPKAETARKETHTLDEHHDHLLSASYEVSFSQLGPPGAECPSSSQVDAPFENFFPFSDGLDLGEGLGDDLARELGWGVSPVKSVRSNRFTENTDVDYPMIDLNEGNELGIDFNFSVQDIPILEDLAAPFSLVACQPDAGTQRPKQTPRKRKVWPKNVPPLSKMGSDFSRATSPPTSFSTQLLSQDQEEPLPLRDITIEELNKANQADPTKKVKRTRLLLDARTELTDDELRVARAKYLESQNTIRREILTKKLEKNSGRIIEELVWGVPKGIEAQSLIDFWQEIFKVQVEARSGALRIHQEDGMSAHYYLCLVSIFFHFLLEGRPLKRRKIERTQPDLQNFEAAHHDPPYLDVDAGMGIDFGGDDFFLHARLQCKRNDLDMGGVEEVINLRHSSEEPGQARRVSRASSILRGHNLAFDLGPRDNANGSQRSSLFPWDNAGASSSNGNAADALPGSETFIDHVDVRLRSNSLSRRDSSIVPSQLGSIAIGGIGFSPVPSDARGSQVFGEDFVFDVENGPEETQQETQKSDLNLIALERNSYNFLEYAKMQYKTLPKPTGQLTFETVVPKLSSTRHVAAAAFYHCLVLATKDLIHLEQKNPYEPFTIAIV